MGISNRQRAFRESRHIMKFLIALVLFVAMLNVVLAQYPGFGGAGYPGYPQFGAAASRSVPATPSSSSCSSAKVKQCRDHLATYSNDCNDTCDNCDLCAMLQSGEDKPFPGCQYCRSGKHNCVSLCKRGLAECAACGISR